MPTLTRPVSELTNHIYMPVCQQLCHRILRMLDYEEVVGDRIYINSEWSTHSVTHDKDDNANVRQTRFTAEVNLQLNPTSQKWDTYTFHHTAAYGFGRVLKDRIAPVYLDRPNHTKIIEMISPITIELNCELYLASAELAFQTPQQLFNGYDNGCIWHYTDLFYDYPVPKPIVTVLYGMWKIDRVYGEPAGVPFTEYIRRNSNGTWNIHKHRELEEYEIVIPCYDIKTLCTLEYSEDKPQGVMEDKLPVGWNIPFRYTIQFGIPTLAALEYPVVVSNTLLPEKYIAREKDVRFNRLPEYRHNPAYSEYERTMYDKVFAAYTVPWYDEWLLPPNTRIPKYSHVPIIYMHLLVDENEHLETKINLLEGNDPSFSFGTFMKAALTELKSNACDLYAPICVWLYKDNKELTQNVDYYVTDDSVLCFVAENLSVNYRTCITINSDIYSIRPAYYSWMFTHFQYLPLEMRRSITERLLYGDWKKYLIAMQLAYLDCLRGNINPTAEYLLSILHKYYYKATQYWEELHRQGKFPSFDVTILEDGTVMFDSTKVFNLVNIGDDDNIDDIYHFTTDSRSISLDQQPININIYVEYDEDGNPIHIHYPGSYIGDGLVKQYVTLKNEVLSNANYTHAGISRYSIITGKAH